MPRIARRCIDERRSREYPNPILHLRDSKYFILGKQGARTYKSSANSRHLNHDDRRYSLGSESVERARQLFSRERE